MRLPNEEGLTNVAMRLPNEEGLTNVAMRLPNEEGLTNVTIRCYVKGVKKCQKKIKKIK